MSVVLGHDIAGNGPTQVVVLNDWIGDTTTWDLARPLFDEEKFSWAFVDLRGYGRSRGVAGDYTLTEASADVMTTVDSLGWQRFAIVGHSMSSLIALNLAQTFADRIERFVAIAPGPPTGIGADRATRDYLRNIALGDETVRLQGLHAMWGDRLSPSWHAFKAARWRAAADTHAVAAYVDMFAQKGVPHPERVVPMPVLAITGEEDAEIMRGDAVRASLSPVCRELIVQPIATAGHYPMQEAPALTYTLIERFLSQKGRGS